MLPLECEADPVIVEEERYDERFVARYVLTLSRTEKYGENYWLTRRNKPDYFILDLGCSKERNMVELVNTHNAHGRNTATKAFQVYFSETQSGPWQLGLSGTLADSRQQKDPLPLQRFSFPSLSGRYVKFQVLSNYGVCGGLQYFSVKSAYTGEGVSGSELDKDC